MAYTNQTNVEAFLGRSLTASETVYLPMLLNSVDSYINQQTETTFGAGTETTRYYDGGMRNIEIDWCYDVDSIAYYDSTGTLIQTYDADNYELSPYNKDMKSMIKSRIGKLANGYANIAVTAKFSYVDNATDEGVPDDIVTTATILVGNTLINPQNLQSESLEGHTVQFNTTFNKNTTSDPLVVATLNKYIRLFI
jgi:hypothetical protein